MTWWASPAAIAIPFLVTHLQQLSKTHFILNSTILIENPGRLCSVLKLSTFYPIRSNLMYSKKVQSNSPNAMNDFVDPRFEDDAIAALMEEAFSETREDKFDVEKFIEGDLDY